MKNFIWGWLLWPIGFTRSGNIRFPGEGEDFPILAFWMATVFCLGIIFGAVILATALCLLFFLKKISFAILLIAIYFLIRIILEAWLKKETRDFYAETDNGL